MRYAPINQTVSNEKSIGSQFYIILKKVPMIGPKDPSGERSDCKSQRQTTETPFHKSEDYCCRGVCDR
jgi:hypothetical protein